jgi:serine phosphatase RsbU (regulator of sigma subunit)
VSIRLQPPGPLTIGRRSLHALHLNDPAVSRDHARLSFRPSSGLDESANGEWVLGDTGSTHGTWLNGVRLRAGRQYHLRGGDLIVIGPWTLLAVDPSAPRQPGTTLATVSDTAMVGAVVTPLAPGGGEALPLQALQLLQRCSERIHAARNEADVVEAALETALAGTSFTRAAFLRPMTDDELIDVVALRGSESGDPPAPQFSRALIREAATGGPAYLTRGPRPQAAGTVPTEVDRVVVLCVPMMVESMLAGFIYLDSALNASQGDQSPAEAGAFPIALARLAAMGLANLMRIDIERRQERMEAELHAAAEAQRWLLPQRQGRCGPFTYVGETRPGQYIGGDFFDIIPLTGQRLAVVVGDVGGKGIPVSVLVSASLGFLHACLEQRGDAAAAVTAINRLYQSRLAHSRFLKLWVGVFDPAGQALDYVVAGHGCAMIAFADGRWELLTAGKNTPVGMKPDAEYCAQSVALTPGGRALILSDGFVEQRADDSSSEQDEDSRSADQDAQPECFGISRAQECLLGERMGTDEIVALFSALEQHAGTTVFDDDATAVVVRW